MPVGGLAYWLIRGLQQEWTVYSAGGAMSTAAYLAEATKQASRAPAGASPTAVANKSVSVAVKKHAPGQAGIARPRGGRRGTWQRKGKVIVLYGA